MSTAPEALEENGVVPSNRISSDDEEEGGSTALCKICYSEKSEDEFVTFSKCGHSFCLECVRFSFQFKVSETRVKLQCLQCSSEVLQEELNNILDEELNQKYLDACLSRLLVTTPNVRYCPAPNCSFACIDISTSKRSEVVEAHFICHQESCGKEFCNSCKQPWHEGRSCDEVRSEMPVEIQKLTDEMEKIEMDINKNTKECPRCHNKIDKMKDTCNMVVCWYCDLKFCWLCGKEVNDWHFFSPTGCTLYGSHSWSRRSLYCCRFWMWVTAPLLLLVLSFIVYPVSLVLVPIGLAYLVYYVSSGRSGVCGKKVCIAVSVIVVVLLALLFDVVIALLCAIAFYIIGLVYVYCCMPLALVLQYRPDMLSDLEEGRV